MRSALLHIFLAFTLIGWVWQTGSFGFHSSLYWQLSRVYSTIAIAQALSGGLLVLLLVLYRNRWLRLKAVFSWRLVRLTSYVMFLPFVATTVFCWWVGVKHGFLVADRFFWQMWFLTSSCWLFLLLLSAHRVSRWECWTGVRIMDITAANLFLTLLLAEGMLSIYGRVSNNPLSEAPSAGIPQRIAFFRYEPGTRVHDRRANRGGYFDQEFTPPKSDELLIALLGDSFGVGMVPYEYNFTRLIETRFSESPPPGLHGVRVDNYSVSGVGPHEYAYILKREVLPREPDKVMVCSFVGNDLLDCYGYGRGEFAAGRGSLQNWRVVLTVTRLWRWRHEVQSDANLMQAGAPLPKGKVPAHVQDPSKERATFSSSMFMQIERKRLEVCNRKNTSMQLLYADYFEFLDALHRRLGQRLLLVLIPDEFQINNGLWAKLMARVDDPEHYDRQMPQKLILAHCRKQGILALDLLPALRKAEIKGHTYHLRDTHWNARGNQVAAQTITRFLRKTLDWKRYSAGGPTRKP